MVARGFGPLARAVPARGPAIAIAATIDDSAATAAAFRGRATCIGVFPPSWAIGGFIRLGQVTVKVTSTAEVPDMTGLVTTEANLIRSCLIQWPFEERQVPFATRRVADPP